MYDSLITQPKNQKSGRAFNKLTMESRLTDKKGACV